MPAPPIFDHPCWLITCRYGRVALIDTDVGQAECSPPGLISMTLIDTPLLGPPESHLLPPHASVFFGDTSPEEDPALFIAACKRLAASYRALAARELACGKGVPLVINTCGWVKGLGLELLQQLLAVCDVTHVALCMTGNPKKDLAAPRSRPLPGSFDASGSKRAVKRRKKHYEASYGKLPTPPPEEEDLEAGWAPKGSEVCAFAPLVLRGAKCGVQPTEMRNRATMSYFGGRGLTHQQVASLLARAAPFAVQIAGLHVRLMRSAVPPHQVLNALIGTVVGLCVGGGGSGGGWDGGPLSVTNAPEVCNCVGLGIVRAADPSKGTLYILTPVSPGILERVDTLVRGRHELCVAMLDWYGGSGAATPYLAAGSLAGAGSGPMKSRSGIMRKGHAGGGG